MRVRFEQVDTKEKEQALIRAVEKTADILNENIQKQSVNNEQSEGSSGEGISNTLEYKSESLLEQAKKLQDLSKSTNQMLIWIAGISLLVGGIGVMNIMLVSVTERTKEIGIRMAVGARQSDILQQFLIEAVLVCLIGGGCGVICSYGIGVVFGMFVSSIKMEFSVTSIVAAVTCSSLIGMLFGYLPAKNAAKLNPIDALARE